MPISLYSSAVANMKVLHTFSRHGIGERVEILTMTLLFNTLYMHTGICIHACVSFSLLILRRTSAPSWRRSTLTSRSPACTTGRPWSSTADTISEKSPRTSSPLPMSATAHCGRGCRTSVSWSGGRLWLHLAILIGVLVVLWITRIFEIVFTEARPKFNQTHANFKAAAINFWPLGGRKSPKQADWHWNLIRCWLKTITKIAIAASSFYSTSFW